MSCAKKLYNTGQLNVALRSTNGNRSKMQDLILQKQVCGYKGEKYILECTSCYI